MQDFIVLGIVPGTKIQLSFMFWVYVGLSFFSLLFIIHFVSKFSLRRKMSAVQMTPTVADFELITI